MSATRKRQLHDGMTIWTARRMPALPMSRRSPANRKCDVLIIGAGISGAMIADALSDAGLDVTIIDRRKPLHGSTCASTALIQYEIDTPLTKLASRIGKARAQRIWLRSKVALDALRERIRVIGADDQCSRHDTLYLDGDVLSQDGLQKEAMARREIGLECAVIGNRALKARFGISGRSALMGYDNIGADPIRLAAAFLRAAIDRGARLYAKCEAEHVEPLARSVRVHLKDGGTIRADHVVFASGYEMPKGVPHNGHKIISTWAIATRPQPRNIWPEGCFIWEAADPYLYLRPGPDGRIICGGEDEEFGDEEKRNALTPQKIAAIEKKLAALFPHVDPRADYAWTGNFGASPTGSPSIGPAPRMPHCYAVFGYGGNGITFSMLAGQMLRNMICGHGDADADLLSFNRKI